MNKTLVNIVASNGNNRKYDYDTVLNECLMLRDLLSECDVKMIDENSETKYFDLSLNVDWSNEVFDIFETYINSVVKSRPSIIHKPLYQPLTSVLSSGERNVVEMITSDELLYDCINMANYLQCDGLLNILCSHTAEKLKNMDRKAILDFFQLEDDLTDEDRQIIEKENDWYDETYYHKL